MDSSRRLKKLKPVKSEKHNDTDKHILKGRSDARSQPLSLSGLIDEFVGPEGSEERILFEFDLHMDLIGKQISELRKSKGWTQTELGERIGVKKAQVSRLERSAKNATIQTLQRVFTALDVQARLQILA